MTRSIGEYQPGVCNIGPAEVRRRRQAGYLGFGAAIVLGAALLLIDAPPVARLLVAAPPAADRRGVGARRDPRRDALRAPAVVGPARMLEDSRGRGPTRSRSRSARPWDNEAGEPGSGRGMAMGEDGPARRH